MARLAGRRPSAYLKKMEQAPLIDPFARPITYLRVSVTDRCDFRCTYCMSEHMQFLPKRDLLTLEELAQRLELTRERVRQIQLEALSHLSRILKRHGISRDALL